MFVGMHFPYTWVFRRAHNIKRGVGRGVTIAGHMQQANCRVGRNLYSNGFSFSIRQKGVAQLAKLFLASRWPVSGHFNVHLIPHPLCNHTSRVTIGSVGTLLLSSSQASFSPLATDKLQEPARILSHTRPANFPGTNQVGRRTNCFKMYHT